MTLISERRPDCNHHPHSLEDPTPIVEFVLSRAGTKNTMRVAQRIQSVQNPVIPIIGEWIAQYPGTISLGQGWSTMARRLMSGRPLPQQWRRQWGWTAMASSRRTGRVAEQARTQAHTSKSLRYEWSTNRLYRWLQHGVHECHLAIADVGDENDPAKSILFQSSHGHRNCWLQAGSWLRQTRDYQAGAPESQAALSPKRAIVTVSPNNPSGAVYSAEDLTATNELFVGSMDVITLPTKRRRVLL